MQQHKHLIGYAIERGFVISVFDGEVWSTKRSSSCQEILEDVEGCDEPQMRILKDSHYICTVAVCIDGDEQYTVQDYTVCDFMAEWEEAWTTKFEPVEVDNWIKCAKVQPLVATPKSWNEVQEWIELHNGEEKAHLYTAAFMVWNLFAANMPEFKE